MKSEWVHLENWWVVLWPLYFLQCSCPCMCLLERQCLCVCVGGVHACACVWLCVAVSCWDTGKQYGSVLWWEKRRSKKQIINWWAGCHHCITAASISRCGQEVLWCPFQVFEWWAHPVWAWINSGSVGPDTTDMPQLFDLTAGWKVRL